MEFDIEDFDALRAYLTARGCVRLDETVSFKHLRGGVSNRTVKVAWADGHVLKQALAKLRVNVAGSAARSGSEWSEGSPLS
jgi:prepilin-type processing-associated H-X9-DG protein